MLEGVLIGCKQTGIDTGADEHAAVCKDGYTLAYISGKLSPLVVGWCM